MFRTILCPLSGVLHCTHSNGICFIRLLTSCEQDQDVPSWSCSHAVWHIPLLCVQWKTPDDGQRNCPKHVEFYSKNTFEKLVHLVGFIIRIYHDARSPERQMCCTSGGGVTFRLLADKIICSPNRPQRPWGPHRPRGPHSFLLNGIQDLFLLGLKRQKREANHSRIFSWKVKNDWSYISIFPHAFIRQCHIYRFR